MIFINRGIYISVKNKSNQKHVPVKFGKKASSSLTDLILKCKLFFVFTFISVPI